MDLDRHVPRDSPVHHFDARLKLVLAVAAIVGITSFPTGSLLACGVVWVAVLALAVVARLSPLRLVRGSWVVLPFAIVALPLVFTRPGEPLLSVDVGPFGLTATRDGLIAAVSIVTKSWVSVQVALLLTYSTPFPDLIDALRSLRVPAILVSIISFMYRYLAVIGEEAGRMTRARASRSAGGIDPPPSARTGGTIRWRARVTGGMVGALFIRSYERSERVHAAMLARGFDGSLARPSLAPPPPGQVAAFGVLLALVVLFTVLVMAWGPGP